MNRIFKKHASFFVFAAIGATLTACSSGASGTATLPVSSLSVMRGGAGAVMTSDGRMHGLGLIRLAVSQSVMQSHTRRVAMSGISAIPPSADLRAYMPAVGDQGQEGSCVGWAAGYAFDGSLAHRTAWYDITSFSAPQYNLSPAFVYNQINSGVDEGASPESALDLIMGSGDATMADMPYVAGQYRTQPSPSAFTDALNYRLSGWHYIDKSEGLINGIKAELATGHPVLLAFDVYDSFANVGPPNYLWNSNSGAFVGGHAVNIVAYSDSLQQFVIQNQWGTSWGQKGYVNASYSIINDSKTQAIAYAYDDPVVQDNTFTYPALGSGYEYDPTGDINILPNGTIALLWSFHGEAGMTGNGSAFTSQNPTLAGEQAAFIQNTGSMSQAIINLQPKRNYTLSFFAAARVGYNGGNTVDVYLDNGGSVRHGTSIGFVTPSSKLYLPQSLTFSVPTPGTHTINFQGLNNVGDATTFITNITVTPQ